LIRVFILLLFGIAPAWGQPVLQIPSQSGLVHYAWQPTGKVQKWIVSLHGTGGSARTDIGIWQKNAAGRGFGLLSIQWWREQGDSYLPPAEIHREIEAAAKLLGIVPGRALLHGFSRGSSNLYAVAALDAGQGRKVFSLFVANSGGAAADYPPNRAVAEGKFGKRPLAGTRWITVCGERDPHPDRDGCPGMRRTGLWLKEQGAQLVEAIEDPKFGHGALSLNPRSAERVLDLFAR